MINLVLARSRLFQARIRSRGKCNRDTDDWKAWETKRGRGAGQPNVQRKRSCLHVSQPVLYLQRPRADFSPYRHCVEGGGGPAGPSGSTCLSKNKDSFPIGMYMCRVINKVVWKRCRNGFVLPPTFSPLVSKILAETWEEEVTRTMVSSSLDH
ncbi:hypothetical protein Micbo1qcDRAFT_9275 [Microdochium bolleyi]|uniref:Uncharacterized protein n=1 Tax=Microdochium bolleyi TaxID=196109 RepID=A0A136JKJ5_9PEZI|nr:hypothetical protein Micbo1qcDRAFT_9275 [Microdochium bolleyi]